MPRIWSKSSTGYSDERNKEDIMTELPTPHPYIYRPLCIYHGNCADGFGAAWVVRKYFDGDVDFHPGVYGQSPPDVMGRHVILVDFSYKRAVLEEMAKSAASITVIDHHKTAQEDLAGYPIAIPLMVPSPGIQVDFDMNRSGAGLTWDYFFPGAPRPKLIDHIEDRDLWRFNLYGTRGINAMLFSHPYEFEVWDTLAAQCEEPTAFWNLEGEGRAIDRKMLKDIAEILDVATRDMVIGGHKVPVVNLPYTMASEAAGKLAEDAPFAAAYFDAKDGRKFSLRSRGEGGLDVSAIAKLYGGGGHRNAAGFTMPIGWEGDVQ